MMNLLFCQRLIAICTAFVSGISAASVFPFGAASASGQSILILGDSISAGDALHEDEYGYYDYLGDMTGMTVNNLAVSGAQTQDLINVIDNSANASAIQNASLICISIGANDLLQPAKRVFEKQQKPGEEIVDTLRRLAAEGNASDLIGSITAEVSGPRKAAKANYAVIEEKLRALNPDAVIVMQTLYNPFEVSPAEMDARNLSEKNRENYKKLTEYVNNQEKILNKAMAELTSVQVADVSGAFAGSGWLYSRMMDEKDVHPSALGHALIAAVVSDAAGLNVTKTEKLDQMLFRQNLGKVFEIPQDDMALLKKYAENKDVMFGDYDSDGEVTVTDAQQTLQVYAGTIVGTALESLITYGGYTAADVDMNQEIGIMDAQFILNYYVSRNLVGKNVTWKEITGNPDAPDY